MTPVTDWASRVTTYTYDAVGRLTQVLRPNGTKQTRVYDDAGQLTQLTELAPDGTTVIYSGAHSYDLAGQLTGETVLPAVAATIVNSTQTFDSDNRLLTHNGAATTFDADGNLLSVASGLAPASYTYDARNRLTAAGGLTYGYNAENRRVSLTDGSGTTSYVVNPNAVPDQVLVKTAPGGTKTFYVYGLGLLHEETGSAVRYYHHDRRGDTVALTDGTGEVTDRASYGVYGELLSRTGTTPTPFLFNGKWGVQTDANGLYYHRARYYHPQLRRFLNQDTVLGDIADSASMNRFAYANGNPVSLVDPFGLAAMDERPTGWLDKVQTGLDGIGILDPTGIADGLNALIHLGRGNWGDAVISAIGVVPYVGDLAKGGKYAKKGLEVAKKLEAAENILPKVNKAVNSELVHASERAAERGISSTKEAAANSLRDLSASITKDGLPAGTILDTAHADRVLVPFGGNGYAVYQIGKNGTAKLKTVLIKN